MTNLKGISFFIILLFQSVTDLAESKVKYNSLGDRGQSQSHQIPVRPSEVPVRTSARGMREPVSRMLMILQIFVFPRPDSAPMVSISTQRKLRPDR